MTAQMKRPAGQRAIPNQHSSGQLNVNTSTVPVDGLPMPDLDHALRFLALLDSDSGPHEWHYRAICPATGRAAKPGGLDALKEKNLTGWGAYVVVNAGGHKTESIKRVRALYVDFDEADDHLDRVRTLVPFEPSIIVESSPGKHHVYWVV